MYDPHERDVVDSIEDVVRDHLRYLTTHETKRWWAADFFDFMERDDYHDELEKVRTQARSLQPGLLAGLTGNIITEEGLPNFTAVLATLFPDDSGVSDHPWAVWQRGWTAEEDQHGSVLHQYLTLTGRVHMQAVDKTIYGFLKKGVAHQPSLYRGLLYPMFQEPATRVSHVNTGRLAFEQGDEHLAQICRNIAGDEQRHGMFFLGVAKAVFEQDPEGMMIAYAELMRSGLVMPARLMTDGQTPAPELFEIYAELAEDLGIYTANDYADIFQKLNEQLGVDQYSVSGKAAEMQETVCKLPGRVRRIAARKKREKREPRPFSWLYGEKA